MHFTKFLLAAVTLAVASAQVKFTNTNFTDITVGTPFTITWTGASSGVTLKLKGGPANVQTLVETIVTDTSGGSFTWTPGSTIVDGTYNFEIDAGGEINYSIQFPITGGLTSSASAAASSTASGSVTSSVTSGITTTGTSTATSVKNGTSSTGSKTSSPTSKSTSAGTSSAAGTVPTSNNAAQYASPFAFVLMSFVAIAALN